MASAFDSHGTELFQPALHFALGDLDPSTKRLERPVPSVLARCFLDEFTQDC
ncbi:MAG TPA: hypothetical protein VGM29_16165 [Polyangiaceae bacterium]